MKYLLSVALTLGTAAIAPAEDGTVRLTRGDDTVAVTIGGRPFTVYNFGQDLPKPFFSPVLGPDGAVLTRPLENPADHPHHKGIWISVDEVNGIRYWAEQGRIRNAEVTLLVSEGAPAKLQAVNHWLGKDGAPLLKETTVVGIHPNGLMTFDVTLAALEEPVTFEDTKEGFLGIRFVDSMREVETARVIEAHGLRGTRNALHAFAGGDGRGVLNADGLRGSRAAWGKASAWVDYTGDMDGVTYGAAIFDHPDNFRPSRYHVRDYGLFSISPFGEKSYTNGREEANPLQLAPGESVRLRYGMYIHAGDARKADVAGTYKAYLEASR